MFKYFEYFIFHSFYAVLTILKKSITNYYFIYKII